MILFMQWGLFIWIEEKILAIAHSVVTQLGIANKYSMMIHLVFMKLIIQVKFMIPL